MKRALPSELSRLLDGADSDGREDAWPDFLSKYSRLILRTARSVTTDHDRAMDAYGFVLEELAKDDYRRLRAFEADGPGRFTTWLVIVARRLCLDHQRRRYGRVRNPTNSPSEELKAKRRLVDLVAGEMDLSHIPDSRSENPELRLRRDELRSALDQALEALAPADQLLLRRRFEDELSVKEIARLMRLPTVFHVYRRLNHLLSDLRARLESSGIDGPRP